MIFAILVIINFVVVTKGAGRVSEVSARFTLDALPGKQMAIDADLNAGVIDQQAAKARREDVAKEADFYGSMDGASKFVRGDAIAGILILVINIVAGLIIGVVEHGMSFSDAGHNYILLTIGDGLAAQIPSLLLSTAAAVVITRVSAESDMGTEVVTQIADNPKALIVASIVLCLLGIIPGMPHFAFLSLGGAVGYGGYYLTKQREKTKVQDAETTLQTTEQTEEIKREELGWDDVRAVDIIGLEVGYRLIPMVDSNQQGEALSRIKGVRKKLSQTFGFLIPSVHIRDNLDLAPTHYRITLSGVPIAEAEIQPDKYLAINPGQVFGEIDGMPGKDPAFGLPAVWIDEAKREQAQTLGYTVVDASTVIATHMSQLLQDNASSLLGHEEIQKLFDRLAEKAPKLVEELIPDLLTLGQILRVLQALLDEQVCIRDIRTIAETLADVARHSKEIEVLVEAVRVNLSRSIVQNIYGMRGELPIVSLKPELEQLLLSSLQLGEGQQAGFEPGMAENLQHSLGQIAAQQEAAGEPMVLLIQPKLRNLLARFVAPMKHTMHVLSYAEIPDNRQIQIVATVG